MCAGDSLCLHRHEDVRGDAPSARVALPTCKSKRTRGIGAALALQVTFAGCSSGKPSCIKQALRANIGTLRSMYKTSPRSLWKVGVDEVAVNQKLDWNSKNDTVGFKPRMF